MKKELLLNLIFLLASSFFICSCEKEPGRVMTIDVSAVLSTTATAKGKIISLGGGVKTYGHCFSTTAGTTTADEKTDFGAALGVGTYTSYLQNLEPGKLYYIRAYIISENQTIYGEEISFTTISAGAPVLSTISISQITDTTAMSGGIITGDGGLPVFARGTCWGLSAGPTISGDKTSDGTGKGTFTSSLSGLIPNTVYHYRAYATNGAGTSYGNELVFTTTP